MLDYLGLQVEGDFVTSVIFEADGKRTFRSPVDILHSILMGASSQAYRNAATALRNRMGRMELARAEVEAKSRADRDMKISFEPLPRPPISAHLQKKIRDSFPRVAFRDNAQPA